MACDFVRCPHRVTMDQFADSVERDPVSPLVELLWEKKHAFERKVVDRLTLPFINLGPYSAEERDRLTLEAMAAGEHLIYRCVAGRRSQIRMTERRVGGGTVES